MTRPYLTTMLDIVRFLLTRIEDDEAHLERVLRVETRGAERGSPAPDGLRAGDRLRAELIAKRHVIGDLQQIVLLRDLPSEQIARDIAMSALRAMVQPYRDHPRFVAAWLTTEFVGSVTGKDIEQQRPIPA